MTDDVRRFIDELPEAVRPTAEALRREIRALVPEAVERTHGGWKVISYSRDGSMNRSFFAIAPHSGHVNLQFMQGAELEDPDGILEGTGKRGRHVKLRAPEDVERPAVRRLMRRVVERSGGS